MRLEPIEHPQGLMIKMAYFFARRRFGKVITPMKVVTARVPKSARVSYEIAKLMEHGFTLDKQLQALLHIRISQVNQCDFCIDIGPGVRAAAKAARWTRSTGSRPSAPTPAFTPVERAALAYVEEVSQTKTSSDATFAELRRHFSDAQIAEITLLNAFENFYNLTNRPLGIESDNLCALLR